MKRKTMHLWQTPPKSKLLYICMGAGPQGAAPMPFCFARLYK